MLGDKTGVCEICGKGNVNLTKKEGTYYWKCGARACKKTVPLRVGSFFENSKLTFESILCLKSIYCWIYECSHSFMIAARIVSTNKTIVDWKNVCRDVCTKILISDNKKLGGKSHVVEIDESKFGKRKCNRGLAVDGCWVLGRIDGDTKETFFQIVEDQSTETLLPILIENIHPDTTVISDCWKSYDKLSEHLKEHQKVNHSLNFVDPNNAKIHTNTIESTWRALKRSNMPKNGTNHNLYSSYFSMDCIKQHYLHSIRSHCPFRAFLELVKCAYLLDKCDNTARKDLRSSIKPVSSVKTVNRPLDLLDDDDYPDSTALFLK